MKKLFILSGGVGREREVSLSSGKNIMEILEAAQIGFESVIVNEDRSWSYKNTMLTEQEGVALLKRENALVFQVIHGTYGEDGQLVGLLEENSILFVGSSSESMRLTMDKYKTEKKLVENNIPTTSSILIKSATDFSTSQENFYPVILKPNKEGSSVGVAKVNNKEEFMNSLEKSLDLFDEMLVQRCIVGREFSCGVMEIDGREIVLTPSEVVLDKEMIFDYHAKYFVNGLEITPAQVDKELKKRIQDTALKTHKATGCKDYSRTDMMLNEKNELIVLEINTVPGMTKVSFIPAQLQASGYSLVGFIEGMIEKYI